MSYINMKLKYNLEELTTAVKNMYAENGTTVEVPTEPTPNAFEYMIIKLTGTVYA